MSGFTTGQNENPNLTDNWDDAEGYYRMYNYKCFDNLQGRRCLPDRRAPDHFF